MNKNVKNAFTLAELMIVFTVIGVLTAILLPSAFHSTPDENILKFKKANNTLYQAIDELVANEKYYKDGDLGVKSDGTILDGTHDGDYTYFCQTLGDVVSTKSVNCEAYGEEKQYKSSSTKVSGVYVPNNNISTIKGNFDSLCKSIQSNTIKADKQIITTDGVVWFEQSSNTPFGYDNSGTRLFGGYKDNGGFDRLFKIFCIDVDGYEAGGITTCDNVKNICPFGYGIRTDGKIIPGARADEWVAKSIQKDD